MPRPCTIDTEQILEAAREVFLERGIDAPTAEIARRAGVSEGSIFRRFPTKQALFLAAMGLDEPPVWIEQLARRAGQGDVLDNLQRILCDGIAFFRDHLPRIMLAWSSRETQPSAMVQQMGPCTGPAAALEALTSYVEAEVALGRLRSDCPEVVARTLLGAITNFAFLETIGLQARGPIDTETYAKELVSNLWQGIRP